MEEDDPTIYYVKPYIYHRPLRPFEKAYMFWYIEMLKPPEQRDSNILDAKYAFARSQKNPYP